MKKNVGSIDKIVRIVIAVIAAYFAWNCQHPVMTIVLWVVSVMMLFTAFMNSCPLYNVLGINTCNKKKETNS